MSKFKREFFAGNRLKLMKAVSADAVIITANGLLQRSADTEYRFRQDPSFWYFTGIKVPDIVVIIESSKTTIVLPKRDTHRDLWEGAIDTQQMVKSSGADEVIDQKQFIRWLKAASENGKVVARPSPAKAYLSAFGMFSNPSRMKLETQIKRYKVKTTDCRREIAALRQVKQPVELLAMQSAIDVTCNTLKNIKLKLTDYTNEAQLERALLNGFLAAGLNEHSFLPVIASGSNAYSIHYRDNNQPLENNSLVLLDVGAECDGYAADITRTWAVGTPSRDQKQAYEFVKDIQGYGISELKIGMSVRQFDKLVRDYAGKQAEKMGYIKNAKDINSVFPYSVSHFLGLDVHDAGDYDAPLRENCVITVEPGLHLKDEGIGVRIEDDVLLTKNGPVVMSRALSNSL